MMATCLPLATVQTTEKGEKTMPKDYIKKLMRDHFVPCYVTAEGRVIVDDVYTVREYGEDASRLFTEEVDVTDWSKPQLWSWLGYSAVGVW